MSEMEDDLVKIAAFPSAMEAEFFRSLLESQGIECVVFDDYLKSLSPYPPTKARWNPRARTPG